MEIIGRRDRVDLSGLGYFNLRAKVDTGAYGSVLHCSDINIIKRDGKDVLSFILLDPEYPEFRNTASLFEQYKDKRVKNSSGGTEHRYTIVTEAVIFGIPVKTEFSLTDRRDMKYPILLGRKFLKSRYLVDVRLKDVSYKLKRKKKK